MDCYQKGKGYYSHLDNKLHFGINDSRDESTVAGFKLNMTTFFHEYGHWLDHNALKTTNETFRDRLPNFLDNLKKDGLEYINNFFGLETNERIKSFSHNSSKEKELFRKFANNISRNADKNSSISDLFDGLTNHKIYDGYVHKTKGYWTRPQQIEKEAVAEMFEAIASGGERDATMEKYFPTAYSQFKDLIRSLL